MAVKHRVVRRVPAGHAGGVGQRRLLTHGGPPDLQRHHRFAGRPCGFGGSGEPDGVTDALQEQRIAAVLSSFAIWAKKIRRGQIGLVAGGGDDAERQPHGQAAVIEREAHPAALCHDAHAAVRGHEPLAASRSAAGLKVAVTRACSFRKPSALGPQMRMPLLRARAAIRACNSGGAASSSAKPEEMMIALRTPAAAHSSSAGSTAAAGMAISARSIGAATAATEGGSRTGRPLPGSWIHRVDQPGIAVVAQQMQQRAADAVRLRRGADHRDGAGRQKTVQGCAHQAAAVIAGHNPSAPLAARPGRPGAVPVRLLAELVAPGPEAPGSTDAARIPG